jgi:methionyl-tRNA formyltransferase
METGRLPAYPQRTEDITHAPKLKKEEGILDWNAEASAIHNHVRALTVWPKSSTFWKRKNSDKSVRLIIGQTALVTENPLPSEELQPPGTVVEAQDDRLLVAAGKHWIRILKLQYPGKAMLDAASFINGYRIQVGDQFQ